jgi:hypothetical protein
MKALALVAFFSLASCGSDAVVTFGNTYFEQRLERSGLLVTVKYFCPITDCYMAIISNGRLAYRDRKFRMPWRIKIWDRDNGVAILVCDQSASNFLGYLRSNDGSFVDAKGLKDELGVSDENGSLAESGDSGIRAFCGMVPPAEPELSRIGTVFLVEDGQERKLR